MTYTNVHEQNSTGASVTAYCHSTETKTITKTRSYTDEYGDFMIDLPSELHSIPNLEKSCSISVHRVPKNSLCKPAYASRHTGLTLSSAGNGIRTYTADNVKFLDLMSRPLEACSE